MHGDPAHQRQGGDRRRQEQVLAGLQVQADLDRRFGELVELDGVDRDGDIAGAAGHRKEASKGLINDTRPDRQFGLSSRRARLSDLSSKMRRGAACRWRFYRAKLV
jgi:hypothetical protein